MIECQTVILLDRIKDHNMYYRQPFVHNNALYCFKVHIVWRSLPLSANNRNRTPFLSNSRFLVLIRMYKMQINHSTYLTFIIEKSIWNLIWDFKYRSQRLDQTYWVVLHVKQSLPIPSSYFTPLSIDQSDITATGFKRTNDWKAESIWLRFIFLPLFWNGVVRSGKLSQRQRPHRMWQCLISKHQPH